MEQQARQEVEQETKQKHLERANRRTNKCINKCKNEQTDERTNKRTTIFLEILCLCIVPLVLAICAITQFEQSAIVMFVAVCACLVAFALNFEASKPNLQEIMPVVVLAALAAAGRVLFVFVPNVKPVSAICVIAGVVFGRRAGFMCGALAALVSNFFFGQGAWTPWQMYAWGVVGYFAGVLGARGAFDWEPIILGRKRTSPVLYMYGFLSCLLYGFLLNTWHILGFVRPVTLPVALITYGVAVPYDITHAVSTVAFLVILYAPWKRKLMRIKRKYAL